MRATRVLWQSARNSISRKAAWAMPRILALNRNSLSLIRCAGALRCPALLSASTLKKPRGHPGRNLRREIGLILERIGVPVELHHHEVAGCGQNEVGTKFSTLTQRADWTQIFKYVVHNVAHSYGKTATFMPKSVVGDNGSGMHVHQSVWKDGRNLFAGEGYAGLQSSRSTISAALSGTRAL